MSKITNGFNEDKAKKAVFYHSQDKDNLDETGSCYLAWAHEIVGILTLAGVKCEWDGKDTTRIRIKITEK